MTVSPSPDRASHSGLASVTAAHPVGLADVLPRPAGFHAVVKSLHSPRGLSGRGRNSPIDGTLVSNMVRLAARTPTITTIQAIAGPSDRGRHLRTLRSTPT